MISERQANSKPFSSHNETNQMGKTPERFLIKHINNIPDLKNENGELVPKPEILRILYDFVYHCLRTNVSRTQEWNTTPKEYLEEYIAFLRGETLPER